MQSKGKESANKQGKAGDSLVFIFGTIAEVDTVSLGVDAYTKYTLKIM